MEARRETEAKKQERSALLLALHSFYNSAWVHGGWLLHGCPQRWVTKKNLMCASLHQGPLAASIWLSAIWCWQHVSPLLAGSERAQFWGACTEAVMWATEMRIEAQLCRCIFSWSLVACVWLDCEESKERRFTVCYTGEYNWYCMSVLFLKPVL